MITTATTLVTGALARTDQLLQHPDRQRGLLAGGEGGDDDLVEAQREGQQRTGQQRRAQLRQDDVAHGLEAVGTQVHAGFDQVRVQAPQRAMALLNTTTTQKVAWPMTMVQNENGMCSVP